MVLPDPVSPTSASVLPAGTSRSMPETRGPVGAGVGEADIVEPDVPGDPGRVDLDRVGGIVDLDRQVEVLEDPREQRQRADHRDAGAEQPGHRPEQAVLQGGEGDQGADGDRVKR